MSREFVIGASRAQRIEEARKAAEAGEDDGTPEDTVVFTVGDRKIEFYYPTPGQIALAFSGENYLDSQRQMLRLLRNATVNTEDYVWLLSLLEDGSVDFDFFFGGDQQNPSGLIQELIMEAAGRPTEPSTGSASSPSASGRPSTGRARGTGSTSGRSRSTAS